MAHTWSATVHSSSRVDHGAACGLSGVHQAFPPGVTCHGSFIGRMWLWSCEHLLFLLRVDREMENKAEPRQRREMEGKRVCVLVAVSPFSSPWGSGSCPFLFVNCSSWINSCSPSFLVNLAGAGFLRMQSRASYKQWWQGGGAGARERLDWERDCPGPKSFLSLLAPSAWDLRPWKEDEFMVEICNQPLTRMAHLSPCAWQLLGLNKVVIKKEFLVSMLN